MVRADNDFVRIELTCEPAYTLAYCHMSVGESVFLERGAMVAMSPGVRVSGGVGPGGVIGSAMRRIGGGDSFFMARYTAEYEGAWVACAPPFPGDVTNVRLRRGAGVCLERGALLALETSLHADVRLAGLSNIVMHEGATMVHVTGEGELLFASYGGLQFFDLEEDTRLVVDTGHIVAFQDTVKLRVGMLSGLATSAVSGEGIVGQFTGPGRVWIQTRAEQDLGDWLAPDRYKSST